MEMKNQHDEIYAMLEETFENFISARIEKLCINFDAILTDKEYFSLNEQEKHLHQCLSDTLPKESYNILFEYETTIICRSNYEHKLIYKQALRDAPILKNIMHQNLTHLNLIDFKSASTL